MRIVFCSNYMNHHQEELSCELYRLTDGEYTFIACSEVDKKRLDFGYSDMRNKYDFILCPNEDEKQKELAEKLIDECDVFIFGSGDEKLFKRRMKTGKLTFRYAERLLKKGMFMRFVPFKIVRSYNRFIKYRNYDNFHILCASAYTASDLKLSGFGEGKCWRWGYYPKVVKHENIDSVIEGKEKNSILWVARFLHLKHPEAVVELADKLKSESSEFRITMVGNGEEYSAVKNLVNEKGLDKYFIFTGNVKSNEVSYYMDKSEIFLFTSDFHEGWGAVLNEAMNSGCACVASHAIGSVPYLINENVNGLVYKNGDIDDLYNKVKYLIDNPGKRAEIGKAAYRAINEDWNVKVAAQRLLTLVSFIQGKTAEKFESGPCSASPIIYNDWYK